ncbi:hypothetical protein ACP70R_018683 [Stipagrostis hirtigluma subsp. patula]
MVTPPASPPRPLRVVDDDRHAEQQVPAAPGTGAPPPSAAPSVHGGELDGPAAKVARLLDLKDGVSLDALLRATGSVRDADIQEKSTLGDTRLDDHIEEAAVDAERIQGLGGAPICGEADAVGDAEEQERKDAEEQEVGVFKFLPLLGGAPADGEAQEQENGGAGLHGHAQEVLERLEAVLGEAGLHDAEEQEMLTTGASAPGTGAPPPSAAPPVHGASSDALLRATGKDDVAGKGSVDNAIEGPAVSVEGAQGVSGSLAGGEDHQEDAEVLGDAPTDAEDDDAGVFKLLPLLGGVPADDEAQEHENGGAGLDGHAQEVLERLEAVLGEAGLHGHGEELAAVEAQPTLEEEQDDSSEGDTARGLTDFVLHTALPLAGLFALGVGAAAVAYAAAQARYHRLGLAFQGEQPTAPAGCFPRGGTSTTTASCFATEPLPVAEVPASDRDLMPMVTEQRRGTSTAAPGQWPFTSGTASDQPTVVEAVLRALVMLLVASLVTAVLLLRE